jgi:modulator of FtsH protease
MQQETVIRGNSSVLATNKVLRNTYSLLALTLLFSAFMAKLSMMYHFPQLGPFMFLGIFFALSYITHKLSNSGWGLVAVFALTGFLGLTLGPMLNYYLSSVAGSQTVMQALGGTAITFFAISAYAIKTEKDFSFLRGFIIVGFVVAILAMLAAYYLEITGLSLAVSTLFIVVSSALILYETNRIIRGGETNYITATVGLYVSIYNIFVRLTHILGVFGND